MSQNYPGAGRAVQTCFVVPDLDVAMNQWQQVGGAGPFHVIRTHELTVNHRGQTGPMVTSLGLAQVGDFHVELIEQHGDAPSVYRDVFQPGTGGLHHIGIPVPDVAVAVDYYTAQGFDVAMSLLFGDTPVAYLDTRSAIGCMTEVIRNDPPILKLYAMIADSARSWDGTDPIRPLEAPHPR